jgi:hypothetical protein
MPARAAYDRLGPGGLAPGRLRSLSNTSGWQEQTEPLPIATPAEAAITERP